MLLKKIFSPPDKSLALDNEFQVFLILHSHPLTLPDSLKHNCSFALGQECLSLALSCFMCSVMCLYGAHSMLDAPV